MTAGRQHDALQPRSCCHGGCFLLLTGRQRREVRRQGIITQGQQPFATLVPGDTGRLSVAEVSAKTGHNDSQRREVATGTPKESVKLPGGGSGTLLESSPEFATFSTECSSSGPFASGTGANVAGPKINQVGWDNGRVAADAKLIPPLTDTEKLPKEAERAMAGNAVTLATATPATVKDNMTIDIRSSVKDTMTIDTRSTNEDEEQVYTDSLCEPVEVLRLAKETEQEALHEMEEAMKLMREVHKRRMEEMAAKTSKDRHSSVVSKQPLKATSPADSLGEPPVNSTKAATKELQAANKDFQRLRQQHRNSLTTPAGQAYSDAKEDSPGGPQYVACVLQQEENQDLEDFHSRRHDADVSAARAPLQQACGKRKGHQVIPLKASMHQGRSDANRYANDYAEILEDRRSYQRAMQVSRTPRIPEEDTGDLDSDAVISLPGATRNRMAGHTVLLDSSQVVSGTVSCPFSSLCAWTCDVCLGEDQPVPKPKAVRPISI